MVELNFVKAAAAQARAAGDDKRAARIIAMGDGLRQQLGSDGPPWPRDRVAELLADIQRGCNEMAVGYDRGGQDDIANRYWDEADTAGGLLAIVRGSDSPTVD